MASNTNSLSLVSASSQYVSIADASVLKPTGNFTIEAWVKTTNSSTSPTIFQSYLQDGNPAGIQLGHNSSGKVTFLIGRNTGLTQGTDYQLALSNNSINDGVYHHIVVSWDGSNMRIYINGIIDTTVSWSNAPVYASGNLVSIGVNHYTSTNFIGYFDGQIDEVRLWSVARTQTEIQANMFRDVTGDTNLIDSWKLNNDYTSTSGSNNGTAIGSPTFSTTVPFPTYTSVSPVQLANTTLFSDANLQAYYKLNGDVTDSGPNGYNLTNNGTTDITSGKFNHARGFASASSQYATVAAANLRISGSQSFSAWIYSNSLTATNTIMGVSDSTATNYARIYTDNVGHFGMQVSGLGLSGLSTTPLVIATGQWIHVVGVYNASTTSYSLYVNGILWKTNSGATGTHTAGTGGFSLGRLGDDSVDYYNGDIDDAAVFNRALTDTEVFNLYTGLAKTAVASNNLFFAQL